jgi:hypothetical protein
MRSITTPGFCSEWRAVKTVHRTAERGHGRREIRSLKVVTVAAAIAFLPHPPPRTSSSPAAPVLHCKR